MFLNRHAWKYSCPGTEGSSDLDIFLHYVPLWTSFLHGHELEKQEKESPGSIQWCKIGSKCHRAEDWKTDTGETSPKISLIDMHVRYQYIIMIVFSVSNLHPTFFMPIAEVLFDVIT